MPRRNNIVPLAGFTCTEASWTTAALSKKYARRMVAVRVGCRFAGRPVSEKPVLLLVPVIDGILRTTMLPARAQFTVPVGEAYVPIEGPRGEHGTYIVSDGTNRPWRVKMRAPSFMAIQSLPAVVRGGLIADVVAVIGSTDVVMGDCDR